MRTSFAVTLTLASASVVLAQNSTLASSGIPTGISQGCTDFLTGLNTDSTIESCLNALVRATSSFDSSNNGGSNATAVETALNNMCSPSFAATCDQSTIRNKIAQFSASCGSDMTPADGSAGNKDLINMYDTLYLVVPLKNAICSKDPNNGKWCINEIGNPSTAASSDVAPPQKRDVSLSRRADNTTDQTNLGTPDMASYRQTGLPYLFITPDSPQEQLCSLCTGNVVGAYVAFETVTPYALGIANSPALGGQVELWTKITGCANGLANVIMNNSTANTGSYGAASGVRVGMTGVVVGLMSTVVAAFTLF